MKKADGGTRKLHYAFLQHITRPCRGSAGHCKDPHTQTGGKEEYLGPVKWLTVGCNICVLLPEVSASPVRLFWVSSFNKLI